ncbi:MAG TPA: hypothetical protein VJ576_21250 [Rhodocyclaceae bacterium]|nr:hypothetical protein [Rhodocyclaceae bacterium]
MNRLFSELRRLYFLPLQPWHGEGLPAAIDLIGADDRVRTLAIDFVKASDWEAAAALCQGVQEDLELPAPAVSVSGESGYRVWFSLAEPVPADEARSFLECLVRRYLADLPPGHGRLHPAASSGPDRLGLAPALDPATGKWSAFIDPAMGSMFVHESGLEMAPNPDRQADLLAQFESIEAADFRRALGLLRPPAEPAGGGPNVAAPLGVGGGFTDPQDFLLAVMNDPAASAGDRIEAAKALLPYFHKSRA